MKRKFLRPDETFSEQVRYDENKAHHGFCRVKDCVERVHSYHHRLPNTQPNRKKFPLFIQSPFNCAALCFDHHEGHATAGVDITDLEAEVYERFLTKNIKGRDGAR